MNPLILLLLLPLLACKVAEHDYRQDWAGSWASDADPDALYHFSLDGTWTGWSISNPNEEQNNGTYSLNKDRYRMTRGAVYGEESFYVYETGRWEIIGEKLVLYQDRLPEDQIPSRFAHMGNIARVYTRKEVQLRFEYEKLQIKRK